MTIIDAPSDRDYYEWLYPSDDPGEDPENVGQEPERAERPWDAETERCKF